MPVSGKKLNIKKKYDRYTLLGCREVFGCFMLGVVLLGFGISFLCLDILFGLTVAMTVIGAIGLAIYLVFAILSARAIINNARANKTNLQLNLKDIPKGYEIGDSFIPIIKPQEEEKNKDKNEIKE